MYGTRFSFHCLSTVVCNHKMRVENATVEFYRQKSYFKNDLVSPNSFTHCFTSRAGALGLIIRFPSPFFKVASI